MVAFAAEHYETGIGLSDPRYVKWINSVVHRIDGKLFRKYYLMHKCSNEEFVRFSDPINAKTAKKVQQLQTEGNFFCFDWKVIGDITLFGSEESGVDYGALDPMLIPCASRVQLYDGSVIGGEDTCVWDKEEVRKYMGQTFYTMAYHNQQVFMKDQYDEDERIGQRSEVLASFTSMDKASWTQSFIQRDELIDEVELFQIGQESSVEFT